MSCFKLIIQPSSENNDQRLKAPKQVVCGPDIHPGQDNTMP